MKTNLYVSHAVLYVFDADEEFVSNRWTEAHLTQRFARRSSTVNILALR